MYLYMNKGSENFKKLRVCIREPGHPNWVCDAPAFKEKKKAQLVQALC